MRRYLLQKRGTRCEICGRDEWYGQPMPVIMDHIDGHAENNDLDNLRMICPNCDALLPTHKARNKGNGRHSRMERYRSGQSF
ncbi:MAG: endonuclease [Thermoleophilia bacterium]|nr:endonuclease [Thermoleophilia bacterium]